MLGIKQEWDRLREAMRRKDQETRVFEYARIRDVSPRAQGFVVAEKEDGTPINVLAGTGCELAAGMQVIVSRISRRVIDWYVLVSVNAATGGGTGDAPGFALPTIGAGSLPAHDLAGAQHAGTLPWGRIDLSLGKPDLGSDLVGVLARAQQEAQVRKEVYQATIAVPAGGTVETDLPGCRLGLVGKLSLSGPEPATLTIYEAIGGAVAYQTAAAIGLPFADHGSPWYWEDASGEGIFRVELTNHGTGPASYVLSLTVLAIGGVGN